MRHPAGVFWTHAARIKSTGERRLAIRCLPPTVSGGYMQDQSVSAGRAGPDRAEAALGLFVGEFQTLGRSNLYRKRKLESQR